MQFFSIKMMEGIIATSYSAGEKFYIDPAKLLPLARFLPQPKYVFFSLHHASISGYSCMPYELIYQVTITMVYVQEQLV